MKNKNLFLFYIMSLFDKLDYYLINDIYFMAYKMQYNDVMNDFIVKSINLHNLHDYLCCSNNKYIVDIDSYNCYMKRCLIYF